MRVFIKNLIYFYCIIMIFVSLGALFKCTIEDKRDLQCPLVHFIEKMLMI